MSQTAAERPAIATDELRDWREVLLRHRAGLMREAPSPADGLGAAADRDLTLRLIDRALAKIDGRGALPFGLCEHTREPIARERLALMPWTPVSIAGATALEDRFMTVEDLIAR